MSNHNLHFLNRNNAGGGYDFGNCLSFNADGLLQWGFSTSGQHTVSFWFKPYLTTGGFVFGKSSVSNRYIQINASTLVFKIGAGSCSFTIPTISVGVWAHYFLARDVSTAKLWINGVESLSGEQVYTPNSDSWNQCGGLAGVASLQGEIDDIWLQPAVVGVEADALDIYNGGAGTNPTDVLGGAAANYRLNESGADTIAVSDTGGVDGTLVGFPASGMWIPHT